MGVTLDQVLAMAAELDVAIPVKDAQKFVGVPKSVAKSYLVRRKFWRTHDTAKAIEAADRMRLKAMRAEQKRAKAHFEEMQRMAVIEQALAIVDQCPVVGGPEAFRTAMSGFGMPPVKTRERELYDKRVQRTRNWLVERLGPESRPHLTKKETPSTKRNPDYNRPDLLAQVPAEIRRVAYAMKSFRPSAHANLVGGAVVDLILGNEVKDWDIEVFRVSWDELARVASTLGPTDEVGRSFGILKLHLPSGLEVDLSIPRRDSKTDVSLDPQMSVEEAGRRRDFTINSVALDLSTGVLYDPYNGLRDLQAGVLKATDPVLFKDDPLRSLRAMQLVSRKAKTVDPGTVEIIRSMKSEYPTIPKSRVLEEWRKLLLKGQKPSRGLEFLKESGWIEHYPELAALEATPQNPEWHPEGDVWVHTKQAADAAAQVRHLVPEHQREAFVFGTTFHDIGKATTTVTPEMVAAGLYPKERLYTAYGHDLKGREPFARVAQSIGIPKKATKLGEELVAQHMRPYSLVSGQAGEGAYSRLARDLQKQGGDLALLARVCQCDACATGKTRKFKPTGEPDWEHKTSEALFHYADKFGTKTIEPLVMGRDLVGLGIKPGPEMGKLLNRALDLQESGHTKDQILEHIRCEALGEQPTKSNPRRRRARSNPLVGWEQLSEMFPPEMVDRATRPLLSPNAPKVFAKKLIKTPLDLYVLIGNGPEAEQKTKDLMERGCTVLRVQNTFLQARRGQPDFSERGDADRDSPMTPFMLLHRMGDMLVAGNGRRMTGERVVSQSEKINLWKFFEPVDWTARLNGRRRMYSTGVNTLAGRNGWIQEWDQMYADLWAKYLITGEIAYDPYTEPKGRSAAWDADELAQRVAIHAGLKEQFPRWLERSRSAYFEIL